jgi:hypothetical protein
LSLTNPLVPLASNELFGCRSVAAHYSCPSIRQQVTTVAASSHRHIVSQPFSDQVTSSAARPHSFPSFQLARITNNIAGTSSKQRCNAARHNLAFTQRPVCAQKQPHTTTSATSFNDRCNAERQNLLVHTTSVKEREPNHPTMARHSSLPEAQPQRKPSTNLSRFVYHARDRTV